MAASLGATSLADVHHEGLNEVPSDTCTLSLAVVANSLGSARPGKYLSCQSRSRVAASRRSSRGCPIESLHAESNRNAG